MTVFVRWRPMALVLSIAVALPAFTAAPVAAASIVTGVERTDWWYDRYGIPEIQAEGWTGAGIQVAVIDGQINPELPVFQGTPLTVDPTPHCADEPAISAEATSEAVHGSNVTALLIGNGSGSGGVRGIAPAASVTFYSTGREEVDCGRDEFGTTSPIAFALERAVAAGARVVSISQGMNGLDVVDAEVVARALAAGVIIVAAVPNEQGSDLLAPADANGVVAVNATDAAGAIQKDENDPAVTDVWPETTVVVAGVDFPSVNWSADSRITGSSFATPLVAGMLAVVWQKYPDATANQLIQSLIHNTTTEDHPLLRDTTGGYGYGPASLRHLLREDPAQYPDENPLLDKSSGEPTLEQIEAASQPTPVAIAPSPTLEPTLVPESVGAPSGIMGGTLIAVVIVILLAVAAAVVVILLVIRRSRAAAQDGGVQ